MLVVPDQPDLRQLIDGALKADKTLAGFSSWSRDYRDHCLSWSRAVEIAGEIRGMRLEVKAYPNSDTLKFRILLIEAKCVWRLDFADDGHINPMGAPEKPGEVMNGPHYHSWADNRRYAKPNSLPQKLQIARLLPANIRTFDAGFRWFCNETRVFIETSDIPRLPKKDTLI